MKYRATFSIDFEVLDRLELEAQTQAFAEGLREFERRFGPANLTVRERRPRLAPRAAAPLAVWDDGAPPDRRPRR